MCDYTLFYKEEIHSLADLSTSVMGDRFISAYNESERVQKVFSESSVPNKHWLVLPEYGYSPGELPSDRVHVCQGNDESSQIGGFFDDVSVNFLDEKIVVDITGFMRPQLAFLMNYLYKKGVKTLILIYSEPRVYSNKEKTLFAGGHVRHIRQIQGFEGVHSPDERNDLLVIGSGYDQNQIKSICNYKENSRKVQLIGFPSLRPDMYQENILRTTLASQELSEEALYKRLLAPANDPFVTASVLSEFVKKRRNSPGISNLYLSPLGTKAQTVGFSLFYLRELVNTPSSLIFPFYSSYGKETSEGINKIWKYTVEF